MNFIDAYEASVRVSRATKAPDAGVVISVSTNNGTHFVIWAIGTDGKITKQTLDASCTDEARLTEHVKGFIANHLAAWEAA